MSEFHKCAKCGHTKEVGKKCQCEVFDKMSEVKVYIFGDEYIGKCYQASSEEYIIKSNYDKLQADLKKAVETIQELASNKHELCSCGYEVVLEELRGEK